jgi:uncharacterized protein
MTTDMNAGDQNAASAPHLPNAAPIDAYGNGGFRFAGMSHRGSLLCLPNGIWASAVTSASEIDEAALALALALEPRTPDAAVDHFLIGTGKDLIPVAPALREAFRKRRIVVESMSTGAAVRTYNILLGERRRVGALLVAVD